MFDERNTAPLSATVLLTGGAGFIGSHAAVELLKAGCKVIIADDFSNSSEEIASQIQAITARKPSLYRVDMKDSHAVGEIFAKHPIDAVMHFAGYKAVGESVCKPMAYYRNNLDATLTLLESMRRYGVNILIFSSSATVYGLHNPVPFTEDMPTGGCSNPYGWTKYMIEQILRDAAAADPALSVVLLRYFNPVGAHESGLIGEKPRGIPNNLMPYIAQVAAGTREKLYVYGSDYPTPDGTGVRDYIHVMDLAQGHIAALQYAFRNAGCEAINLGTGSGTSVLAMVQAFEKTNGVLIPYELAPRRPGDISACYSNVNKAAKLLGWRAKKSVEDMCRDTWRWQIHTDGDDKRSGPIKFRVKQSINL